MSATIHVGKHPLGVAITPNAVWVANDGVATPDTPSVSRIDPATNKVVATIPLGPTNACCSLHMEVIAAGGVVWAVVPQGNSVVRIDPETNEKTVFKLDFPPCAYLDADESAVWSNGWSLRRCRRPHRCAHPRPDETRRAPPIGLKLAFGHVWVASLAAGNVDQIDRRTDQVVARLPVGGLPIHLAVGFGSIWVLDGGGRDSASPADALAPGGAPQSYPSDHTGLGGIPHVPAVRSPLLRSRCHAPRSRRET